ncbi:anti-sigma factor family protein [Streptomyces olivoreticuli]|uniref:anti-sigma factor family protein n=1 Tax=Streptomyces olivoreticuli TaxID=68246 RepID=UPI000E253D8A|nr:zf-HC2 domain-containing protein [Streptomyces olivoreticuli]
MTSTTGTDEHPEVAEISALTEGALSPSRSADVREHLADCPLCEDVRISLDEIRTLLGTLPGPPRMPDDVAGRIDAALAAEALLDSTTHSTADSEGADTLVSRGTSAPGHVSRETATRPPQQVSRETAAPASDRVSRETSDRRPAAHPRGTTGPGRRTPSPSGPRTVRSRRWPKVLLGTACAAAVLGVGSLFLPSGGDGGHQGDPQALRESLPPVVLASGDLKTRVHDLLKMSFKATETHGKSSENAPETTMRDSGTTAPACIQQGIGRPEPSLAAQPDSYKGENAYLVVMPHPTDAALVDAYVVASHCVETSPAAPGKVLLKQTLPRS